MTNADATPLRRALDSALAGAKTYHGAEARPYVQQWMLTLRHALPHASLWNEARALLLLVIEALASAGRQPDTLEWLERGIAQCEAHGDEEFAARLKLELGRERLRQANLGAATALLREGAAYFEAAGIVYAPALNTLSHLALAQSHWSEATAMAQRALDALTPRRAEDWVERGQAYRNLGTSEFGQFHMESALRYFEESLREWQSQGSPRYTAFGLVNTGGPLRALGRFDEAEANYKKAIALFEEVGDPLNRSFAQLNLGNVYLMTEQWEKAIEQYYAAEQVLNHSHYHFPLARLYCNWGMAYQGQKEWQRALRIHERNLPRWTELNNRHERANEWDNIGVTRLALGRVEEAIDAFMQGLEDVRDSPPEHPLHDDLRQHLAEAERRLRE